MADDIKTAEGMQFSRREFITGVGGAGLGLVFGGMIVRGFMLPDEVFAIPASEGYLLVDTKKCAGCASCMLACSMVHSGESNLSLSRIQVTNNVFEPFPGGIEQDHLFSDPPDDPARRRSAHPHRRANPQEAGERQTPGGRARSDRR